MRTLTFVLLGLLVLAAGCSSGKKSQILGKWKPLDNPDLVMEITASEITTTGPGGKLVSPYRFVDADTIESETKMLGQKFTNRYKVAFNGDEMTWTDEKGKVKRLERLK